MKQEKEDIAIYTTLEQNAVKWLAKNSRFFDPGANDSTDNLFICKALVELSLLIAYRTRLIAGPLPPDYQMLLTLVKQVASRATYRDRMARDTRAMLLYGLTYAALKICGSADPEAQWILDKLLATRYPQAFERIPYRQLDLLHFLWITQIEHNGPTFEDVFPMTLLAQNPLMTALSESDVYAITHTLFYMTDFGLRSSTWSPTFNHQESIQLVLALLQQYRERANADLVGELIASAFCLGVTNSPELDHSWVFLQQHQAVDGSIPGPPDIVAANQGNTDDPERWAWKTSYHTTIVGALVALMAQRAATVPGYPVSQPSRSVEAIPGALSLQTQCQTAIARAVRWLSTQMEQEDLSKAIRAAAGVAIAMDAIDLWSDCTVAYKQIARRIDDATTEQCNWQTLGADTMCLLAYGLWRTKVSCDTLNTALIKICDLFDMTMLREYPAVLSTCTILAHIGMLDRQAIIDAATDLPPVDIPVFAGSDIVDVAQNLLTITGGEMSRLAYSDNQRDELVSLLSSSLSQESQRYTLDRAAILIRLIVLLGGPGNRAAYDATMYLLSQQRSDGAFGYLAGFISDSDIPGVQLVWTIAILWVLIDIAAPTKVPIKWSSLYRGGSYLN